MNINCTVIIQICNFFLVWLLLEKILLKPLLKKIIDKSTCESNFLASVENIKQNIMQLDQDRMEQWRTFNKYCLQNIPISKTLNPLHEQQNKSFTQNIDIDTVNDLALGYSSHITRWLREIR